MANSEDEMIHIFVEEATELLETSELALLKLDGKLDEENVEEQERCIAELFRGFHTIKGSAGLFDITPIVDFTHVVESVLSRVRSQDVVLTSELLALFLESRDYLALLVNHVKSDDDETDTEKEEGRILLERLAVYLETSEVATKEESVEEVPEKTQSDNQIENKFWHISLRFTKSVLQCGMDPYSFIKYLNKLGELVNVQLVDDAVPPIENFVEPETCYLGFEISLDANTSKQEIESVFEFVEDEYYVKVLPPQSSITEYIDMISSLPESQMRIGEILVNSGALTEKELEYAIREQSRQIDEATCNASAEKPAVIGDVLVKEKMVDSAVVEAAAKKQERDKQKTTINKSSVRVNACKLEQLINLVGELVIGGANAELRSRKVGDADLIETMENMSRLVEEMRDTTLGLRMVPIGDTFSRFRRVVHEASKHLDKQIELKISGEETELDKTLVEKIADPLVHLLRNAVDHGIETTDIRVANGKDPKGTVFLDAFHDSGHIVIRVEDDGAGLDKEKIMQKAVSNGLVSEGEYLTDSETYRLIFEPGFSTASEVTNLSGRGVGMDVVKKNIESLRGVVEVKSEKGKGATFDIRLPLTLAIIDGFQVSVGSSQYIIPLNVVEECIELEETEELNNHNSHYINLRGSILPYVRLRDFFKLGGEPQSRENIVVVNYGGRRAGLVVDDLHGEHQTVIKPLGVIFQNLRSISGATILGNGDVALIADVQNLMKALVTSARDKDVPQFQSTTGNRDSISIN